MSQRQPSLARRAFPAIALTAVGVGMVQALDRSSLPIAGVSAASVNAADGTLAPTDTTATTLPASGSASAAGGVPTATVAPSATTVAPVVTAAPATAAPAACGAMSGTGVAGDITARRNYGTVTVTAKFTADGTLCDASATYVAYDQKSVRYEEYSIPILNQQAIAAKSANIQGISGATAVSDGYRTSLQSAIDNKH